MRSYDSTKCHVEAALSPVGKLCVVRCITGGIFCPYTLPLDKFPQCFFVEFRSFRRTTKGFSSVVCLAQSFLVGIMSCPHKIERSSDS